MRRELKELKNKKIVTDFGGLKRYNNELVDQLSEYEKKRDEFVQGFETHGHDFDKNRDSNEFIEAKAYYKNLTNEREVEAEQGRFCFILFCQQ